MGLDQPDASRLVAADVAFRVVPGQDHRRTGGDGSILCPRRGRSTAPERGHWIETICPAG
jgi:hypothetical protein